MHCDAFPPALRARRAARSAEARGQPLDPAEELSPSDFLVFLGYRRAMLIVQG